jgi:hypothetical protein
MQWRAIFSPQEMVTRIGPSASLDPLATTIS